MSYFDQLAQKLLSAEYDADGLPGRAEQLRQPGHVEAPDRRAVRAIKAALFQSYAALRPKSEVPPDLRKTALGLLAAHYDRAGKIRDGRDIRADDLDTEEGLAVSAIVEALTPVEGYVLVPATTIPAMRAAFRNAYRDGGFWSDRLDHALQAMLAARPEVPRG